jgi:hypothetical protein
VPETEKQTAVQEPHALSGFVPPVVEVDEERWRAWQAKSRAMERIAARRRWLWLTALVILSSASGLIWWLAGR